MSDMSDLNKAVTFALDQSEQPEDDALNLLHYLMERFGWAGTIMTRNDAEVQAGRDLTDEEWEAVRHTKPWRDMGSIWLELDGWEPVTMALDAAGVEIGEEE